MVYTVTYGDNREYPVTKKQIDVGAVSPAQARLVLAQLTGLPQQNIIIFDMEYEGRPSDGEIPNSYWKGLLPESENTDPAPAAEPVSLKIFLADGDPIVFDGDAAEVEQYTTLSYLEAKMDRDISLNGAPLVYVAVDGGEEAVFGSLTADVHNTRRITIVPNESLDLMETPSVLSLRIPVDSIYNWDYIGNPEITLTLTVTQKPVQLLAPENIIITDGLLTWDSVTHATGYKVFESGSLIGTTSFGSEALDLSTLTAPGPYSITIVAVGNGSIYLSSNPSDPVSYMPQLPAVTGIQLDESDPAMPKLTWSNNLSGYSFLDGAVLHYDIFVNGSTSPSFTTPQLYSPSLASFHGVGVTNFEVQAVVIKNDVYDQSEYLRSEKTAFSYDFAPTPQLPDVTNIQMNVSDPEQPKLTWEHDDRDVVLSEGASIYFDIFINAGVSPSYTVPVLQSLSLAHLLGTGEVTFNIQAVVMKDSAYNETEYLRSNKVEFIYDFVPM